MEVWTGGLKAIIGMILPRKDKRFLNRSGTSSEIWGKKRPFYMKNHAISTVQIQKQKEKGRPRPLAGYRTAPNPHTSRY